MSMVHYSESRPLLKRSKFSLIDVTIIIFSAALVAAGAWLLHNAGEGSFAFRDLEPIAAVTNFTGESKRKIVGTISWGDVRSGMGLYRGDQVLTGDFAETEVEFNDKSTIKIPANSLVKIDYLDEGSISLELIKGMADVRFGDSSKKVIIIDKDKKQTVLEGKNSDVRLYKRTEKVDISPTKGEVKIFERDLSPKPAPKPGEIEQVSAKPEARVVKAIPIGEKTKLVLPPLQKSINPNESPNVEIKLSHNRTGKILLSKTLTYDDVIETNISGGKTEIETPPPGTYYVAFHDESGTIEDLGQITVDKYEIPKVEEKRKSTIRINKGERVTFEWEKLKSKVATYQVEIKSRDGIEKKLTTDSKDPTYFFPEKETEFQYRVKLNKDGAPWSPWYEKKIKFKTDGFQVDEKLQHQKVVMNEESIAVPIAVKNADEVNNFEFTLARDPNLNTKIMQKTQKTPEMNISLKKHGEYFWRIKKAGDSSKGYDSGVQRIIVKEPMARVNTKKYEKRQIVQESVNPRATLNWKNTVERDKVIVQISKDKTFNNVLKEEKIEGDKLEVELPTVGKYYWRVLPEEKEEYIVESPPIDLDLELPPQLGQPKLAEKQIITFKFIKGKGVHEIQLPRQEWAKNYHIQICEDINCNKILVNKMFKNEKGYWLSQKSGRYYYKLRIIDIWDRKGPWSRIGELIFPISPFIDMGLKETEENAKIKSKIEKKIKAKTKKK